MDPNTPAHYHDSLFHDFSVGIELHKMTFFGYETPTLVLLLLFPVVIYLLSFWTPSSYSMPRSGSALPDASDRKRQIQPGKTQKTAKSRFKKTPNNFFFCGL
jgi:hypothetical protein